MILWISAAVETAHLAQVSKTADRQYGYAAYLHADNQRF